LEEETESGTPVKIDNFQVIIAANPRSGGRKGALVIDKFGSGKQRSMTFGDDVHC